MPSSVPVREGRALLRAPLAALRLLRRLCNLVLLLVLVALPLPVAPFFAGLLRPARKRTESSEVLRER
jgi:hypothetical protein